MSETVRAGSAQVGGLKIAYDVRGEGETLVLLPGVTMRRLMWPDALADGLAARGLRVIRMDNRDAGGSSRVEAAPPNVPATLLRASLGLRAEVPYRLEDMAGDVLGLMEQLGVDRFHVAGASMGGMIAQTTAIVAPERVRTLTSVMSSPGGRRNMIGEPRATSLLLRPPPRTREAHRAHLLGVMRVLHGGELPLDEAALESLVDAQLEAGSEPPAAARQMGAIFESSMRRRALLAKVRTPTLVLHGARDPLLPLRGARAMAGLMPNAKLHVVRGMGHTFPAAVHGEIVEQMAGHIARAN